MSDEEKGISEAAAGTVAASEEPMEQPVEEEHTTAPNPPPSAQAQTEAPKWEMPKPVFQKTSGYLPQGFIKEFEAAANAADEQPTPNDLPSRPAAKEPDLSAINLSAPAATAVEPQPDLSEQLIPDDPDLETKPQPVAKNEGIRASMIVAGLIAILAFVTVFLTVIYYLFLKEPGGANNF